MKKRNLLNELMEGVEVMREHREGKRTLRTHDVEKQEPLHIDSFMVRETREQLNVSREIFARHLRVSTRTLENWEQGRAEPNSQAAALILMVRKYPDTMQRLQELT